MPHQIFNLPPQQPLSAAGRVLPGSKASFFLTETDTPTPVYTTSALNVTHTQPVEADAGGRFPAIYLDPTITYKVTVTNSADVLLYTVDPVNDQLLSQAVIGEYLYPRTSAEQSAGVTPVNYAYPPGDVRRYGAVGDDSTDCTDAFQAAINQAAQTMGNEVFIPNGTFLITSTLTGIQGLKMTGAGRYKTIVQLVGAIQFLTYTGTLGNPDGGSIVFRDFTLKGSTTAGNFIELTTAGQNEFHNMRFWRTNASFVVLDEQCHRTTFKDCLFQSWATAAVYTSGVLNSILSVQDCQFNILGADGITQGATSTCISLGAGEQIRIKCCNVNGDETLHSFVKIRASSGRMSITECYVERVTGPCVISDDDAVIWGACVENCQFSTDDSMSIDLSTGNEAHAGVFIRHIRRPETGAVRIFNPGSGIIDFDYAGIVLDGSADHVQGFSGYRAVRKYADGRIELNGNPNTAVTTLNTWAFAERASFAKSITTTGVISPSQITADQNDYNPTGFLDANVVRLSSDASRTITGMARDGSWHFKWLVNVGSQDIVLAHQSGSSSANQRFRLPGGANYTLTPGSGVMAYYDAVQDSWGVLDK